MKKVLIVDDSGFSRTTIKKALANIDNYEVVGEAVDGADGVEQYKTLQPDLIITDMEMPNLNGLEMIKKIRILNNDVKIVMVTSVTNKHLLQDVKKLKTSIITKPFKEEDLLRAIKSFR